MQMIKSSLLILLIFAVYLIAGCDSNHSTSYSAEMERAGKPDLYISTDGGAVGSVVDSIHIYTPKWADAVEVSFDGYTDADYTDFVAFLSVFYNDSLIVNHIGGEWYINNFHSFSLPCAGGDDFAIYAKLWCDGGLKGCDIGAFLEITNLQYNFIAQNPNEEK